MKTLQYNIHDWLRFSVSGASEVGLKDFNCRYSYFEVASNPWNDIEVVIREFEPDLIGTYIVDRKYFIKPNFVFFEDSDKGLRWKVQITGLNEAHTKIKVQYSRKNKLKWPWCLFSDAVLYLYILQPLIEYKLSLKNIYLMHAAAVNKPSGAIILAGRGGTYKTTLASKMLSAGHSLLGDDLVFFDRSQLYACPIQQQFFHYYWKKIKSEDELTFFNRIRLFAYLLFPFNGNLPISEPCIPKKLFLLRTQNRKGQARLIPCKTDLALHKLSLNNKMEETAYTDFKYKIGHFLEAYSMVFPQYNYLQMHEDNYQTLVALLGNIPTQILDMPNSWSDAHAEVLIKATSQMDSK